VDLQITLRPRFSTLFSACSSEDYLPATERPKKRSSDSCPSATDEVGFLVQGVYYKLGWFLSLP